MELRRGGKSGNRQYRWTAQCKLEQCRIATSELECDHRRLRFGTQHPIGNGKCASDLYIQYAGERMYRKCADYNLFGKCNSRRELYLDL